jgi:acetoin utilization deacetylase AcuC-like enzyme
VRRAIAARLIPALRAFSPDIIYISAGFDGGKEDAGNFRNVRPACSGMNLLPEDFEWITRQIGSVARICCPGRIVSVLEGGYGRWRLHTAAGAASAARAQEALRLKAEALRRQAQNPVAQYAHSIYVAP